MKFRILFSIILGLLLAFCFIYLGAHASAQAAVYYVDQDHPAASDENPGTEDLPWMTIQKAADTVDPGDIVYVKTGVYDERVLINRGGTSVAKITFAAIPRRSVRVLHGFNISADAIRLEGFDITHDVGGWLGGGIWMGGHEVELVDNYIHNVPGGGITVSWAGDGGWENVYIANNYIYGCNKGISGISGDGWLVENNEIERLIRPASNGEDADYMRFFGTNHVIRGNYFHGTLPEEIGTSHVDCFQTYDNNDSYAHNILFEHNICLGFVHQVFMMEGNGSSHSNITIRYNVLKGFTSWGIAAHNIQNLRVFNNTWFGLGIEDPTYSIHGVGFRDGTTGEIKNNIFTRIIAPYWHDESSSYENGNNLIFECRDEPGPSAPTDLIDVDPRFLNSADILGPDGLAWTLDDGLHLQFGSPAINGGENGSFIGAYAFVPDLQLNAQPADQTIYLTWEVRPTLLTSTTWTIAYTGPPGTEPLPIVGLPEPTRSYTLTGLTNGEWYTVTLTSVGATPVLSDTLTVMPTDRFQFLPLISR